MQQDRILLYIGPEERFKCESCVHRLVCKLSEYRKQLTYHLQMNGRIGTETIVEKESDSIFQVQIDCIYFERCATGIR